MQCYKDLLASTHPIFRVPSTRIFWFDSVMKKNTHQSMQPRFLAITSPGIFLFERRAFPKGLAISRVISYSELVLICADSETMQFYKAKVTMNIQHAKHLEAFAIVLAVRNALFGDKPRLPKIVIDPSVANEIEKYKFAFESEVLIADRFLSLCLNIDERYLVTDQIIEIYENLRSSAKSIQISAEMITSPLIEPVSLAIAYDREVQSLHLKNLNFPSFVNNFIPIVLYNSSIQRLYLSSVSFSGKIQPYIEIWNEKTAFSVNQFIFNDCQLMSTDFVAFLRSFKKYPADMQSLLFIHTNLSTLVVETIFNTISTSPCFRTLSELYFSEMRYSEDLQVCFIQFFTSDFLTEQKNLRSLSLVYAGIELDQVLPYLLHNESNFTSLSLNGNKFLNKADVTDFQHIEEINFSQVSFTAESFLGLLKCLSKAKNSPVRLTFDSLIVEPSEWTQLYKEISTIILPRLTMLSWCGNVMRSPQMLLFKDFLLSQPSLTDIGLSNSFPCDDCDDSLRHLIEVVEKRPIRKLELRGYKSCVLSQRIIPLLNALNKRKTIKMLDITGQEVGDIGLEIVVKLAQNALEELRFDRSTPSSVDVLTSVVTQISQSSLLSSEWPESDCMYVISKAGLSMRPQITRQLDKVKKMFLHRFAQEEFNTADPSTTSSPSSPASISSPSALANSSAASSSSAASNSLNATATSNASTSAFSNNASYVSSQSLTAKYLNSPDFDTRDAIKPRINSILQKRMKDDSSLSMPPQLDLNILSFREEYVDNALSECFGEESEPSKIEPLVDALEKLNEETSISAFLGKQQNM